MSIVRAWRTGLDSRRDFWSNRRGRRTLTSVARNRDALSPLYALRLVQGRAMVTCEVLAVQSVPVVEQETFEEIFDRFERPIYNYVLRLMGNAEDARDLPQESFLKAFSALPKMPSDLAVGPWLYRIATNTCLDELRRRRVIKWQPWDSFMAVFHPKQVDEEEPEREVLRLERADMVQQVLMKLPPKYRLCLLLREYQECSCDEIGAVLGISRGAVKSLLFRAREEFRRVYRGMAPAGEGVL